MVTTSAGELSSIGGLQVSKQLKQTRRVIKGNRIVFEWPHFMFLFAIYILIAAFIWHNVLKPGAYPDFVPSYVRWIHGLVLFYVFKLSFNSFIFDFMWLIMHPHEFILCLRSAPNVIGTPAIGIAALVRGLAGAFLIRICLQMARRNRRACALYFIVWPIHILCLSYLEYVQVQKNHVNGWPLLTGALLVAVPSVFSLLFYMSRHAKAIFGFGDKQLLRLA
jgi:hypothetical protein